VLAELLLALATPCPSWARRLGYRRQAVGLWSRHRRCRAAWQPHLEACHRLILEAAALCPDHRRAVVLGSGLLAEIPLAALAARFERVELIDAVHLPTARRQARRFANVRLLNVDLSLPPAAWEPPELLVSANLLSQLPLLPLEALAGALSPAERQARAQGLIRRHLDWLATAAAVPCLITDTASRLGDGPRVVEQSDPLHGVTLPEAECAWWWALAPRPEEHPTLDRDNRVAGWRRFPGLER
jgi:hypothetical protein